MNQEKIEEFLAERGFDDTIIFKDPDYATAAIGVTTDGRMAYDYDQMVEYLMERYAFPLHDAEDFIECNAVGACAEGDKTSIIIHAFP